EAGYRGMGTTIVLAVVVCKKAFVANIGDSRAYILNSNKKLYQLTKDHSLVQELFEQGKINKEEVLNHPHKNMITRAVGVNISVNIDIKTYNLLTNEKILLCSDGLTNMVDDITIEKTIASNNAKTSCANLINLANEAGGFDNITVAIIE
ncbi:MAG: protein phosphatase 2C domain-containing protein, partial [Oscillospiraceae bacterium]